MVTLTVRTKLVLPLALILVVATALIAAGQSTLLIGYTYAFEEAVAGRAVPLVGDDRQGPALS